jgi:hypothetical protein
MAGSIVIRVRVSKSAEPAAWAERPIFGVAASCSLTRR